MGFNIAIDGPAGAGKSTIARKIAAELSFIYVDTGAMYRAIAYGLIRQGIGAEEQDKIAAACESIDVKIAYQDGGQIVLLNGENVNPFIRTEEVSRMTSAISVYPVVRAKLLELQRILAAENDVLMDGRDIGTCILPNAELKVYLTASSKVRAKRRYLEYVEKGQEANLEEIEQDIIERDYRDMHREVAPLKQAEDAVVVDSSDMTIEEVVACVVALTKERMGVSEA